LQVGANEIGTGGQIAQNEPAVPVGHRECAGTPERGNHDAGERLRAIIEDRSAQFGDGQ
jgi:hypothetical protein